MNQQSPISFEQVQYQLPTRGAFVRTLHQPLVTTSTTPQRRRSSGGRGLLSPTSIMSMAQSHGISQRRRALSQNTPPLSQNMRRTVSSRSESGMASSPSNAMHASLGYSQETPPPYALPRVLENPNIVDPGIGIDPDKFIGFWDSSSSYLASTGTNLSPGDMYTGHSPSAPPSMISTSSAPEAPYPMTRENSAYGSSNMARVASIHSQGPDAGLGQYILAPSSMDSMPYTELKGSDQSSDLLAIGTSLTPPSLHQFSSSGNPNLFLAPSSTAMERGESSSSARSAASRTSRRAKEAHQRVVRQANKSMLAPKPLRVSGGNVSGEPSKAKERRVVQSKHKYQRPKHPKVQCNQCNEHPHGFRGDHELRRHVQAKHEGIVKKYVCRDPADYGIPSKLTVLYPLSKCKACSSGKQYGAYYNAAAHLRRTHFRPKPARGKNRVPAHERRGGKGGGDLPPMSDLKVWFQEVRVQVDRLSTLDEDDEVEDDYLLREGDGMDPSINAMFSDMPPVGFADGYSIPYGRDFSNPSGIPSADGSMMTSFDFMSPLGQSATELGMLGGVNDGSFHMSVASTNVSISPTFPGMNQLSLSDEDWDIQNHTATNSGRPRV